MCSTAGAPAGLPPDLPPAAAAAYLALQAIAAARLTATTATTASAATGGGGAGVATGTGADDPTASQHQQQPQEQQQQQSQQQQAQQQSLLPDNNPLSIPTASPTFNTAAPYTSSSFSPHPIPMLSAGVDRHTDGGRGGGEGGAGRGEGQGGAPASAAGDDSSGQQNLLGAQYLLMASGHWAGQSEAERREGGGGRIGEVGDEELGKGRAKGWLGRGEMSSLLHAEDGEEGEGGEEGERDGVEG